MGKRFGTVAILGVGLIGGSIGLALRKRNLADKIVGIGRRQSRLDAAHQKGAVTDTTTDIKQGVAEADLVVVCTPVTTVADFVREMADSVPAGAVITDAASTKASIVTSLEPQVAAGLPFVGSHPLAGSHLTGVAAAIDDLFEDRNVIITPTKTSGSESLQTVTEFWAALGAKTHHMDANAHDEIVASTSHLPHVVAAALAGVTPEPGLPFTAAGWCDTTRVAAGSPKLWLDILQDNQTELLAALDRFGGQMDAFRQAIEDNNQSAITELLEQGKQRRDVVGN